MEPKVTNQGLSDSPETPTRELSTPAVTFESVTFSDGTTLALEPAEIVLLVGPNNAGKV